MNRREKVNVEVLERRAEYLAERLAERRRIGQKFKLGDYEASEHKALRWALRMIERADELDLLGSLAKVGR